MRKAAGIDTVGWDYGQSGVVATVRLGRDHGNVAHEYFLPVGPFAILPLTDRRASLVWTETTRRAEALRDCVGRGLPVAPDAPVRRLPGRRRRWRDRASSIRCRCSWPRRLTAPRTALIGDAAHAVHPVAGQGLNMGLKDAAALAEVLIEAMRLGEDIGSETMLDRYARWRRFDNAALAAGFDGFVRLFSNDHRAGAAGARPRHRRRQPHRPPAPRLHARGRRRDGRSAEACCGARRSELEPAPASGGQRVAPGFHLTSSAPLALARRAAQKRWSDRRFR